MPSEQDKQTTALFQRIETIQFLVELGVASGLSTFIDILTSNAEFIALQKVAEERPNLIIERMLLNATYSFDHRYENPYDTAAATYYYALFLSSIPFYSAKAKRIIGYMDNTFWSRQIVKPRMHSLSKIELGWKYWPMVCFHHLIYTIQTWWDQFFR